MSTEPLTAEAMAQLAVVALENMKGIDIRLLDVRGQCNFTDFMVFSSGTSDRHLKSQGNSVVEAVKAHGIRPLGVEGDQTPSTEWVLVDLVDVVVHVMLPETRDHYQLEKLWSAQGSSQGSHEDLSEGPGAKTAQSTPSAYASALEKMRSGGTAATVISDEVDGDEEWEDLDLADRIDNDLDDDTPPRV